LSQTLSASFTRELRLLDAADYKYVFAKSRRFGNQNFTLLVRVNQEDHARMGLAIAKKAVKRAVDRNRIKRMIRESFRHVQHDLPNIDVVIMCRSSAIALEKADIRQQFDKQWSYISRKLNLSTTTNK
jgi:ribonuclease P protein component